MLEIFPKASQIEYSSLIKQHTSRKSTSCSVAYYNGSLYWVFALDGGVFTVLNEEGKSMDASHRVCALLAEVISGEFIDLKLEQERIENEREIESRTYSCLVMSDGEMTEVDLLKNTNELYEKENRTLSKELFYNVLSSIKSKTFIECNENRLRIVTPTQNDKVSLFKSLFGVGISPNTLSSKFYKKLIDNELVDEIERIQHGIKIATEDREMCIKALSLSPSALSVSISEIPLITNHRKTNSESQSQFDEHDNRLYLRTICENFMRDYEKPELTSFYFDMEGIEELDFSFDVKIKTSSGIHLEHQNRKRSGIGRMSDEHGGNLIRILTLNTAPEPWER